MFKLQTTPKKSSYTLQVLDRTNITLNFEVWPLEKFSKSCYFEVLEMEKEPKGSMNYINNAGTGGKAQMPNLSGSSLLAELYDNPQLIKWQWGQKLSKDPDVYQYQY